VNGIRFSGQGDSTADSYCPPISSGEDSLDLLKKISHRVVTMHASDCYLSEGTLDDLRRVEDGAASYAKRLRHAENRQGPQ